MNDKAVSPVIGVILMVSITIILAAVIAAVIFGTSGNPERCCDKDVCGDCNHDKFCKICNDGIECNDIQTKTSVIHIEYDRYFIGSNDYVVDADGIAYDWRGMGTSGKFDKYDCHNVTFTYNPCDIVRGRYFILDVIEDHSCNLCKDNPCECKNR